MKKIRYSEFQVNFCYNLQPVRKDRIVRKIHILYVTVKHRRNNDRKFYQPTDQYCCKKKKKEWESWFP